MARKLGGHVRSNVVAYVALFFALAGVSHAAVELAKNSVGAREIKRGAVGAPQIKKSGVRAPEIKPNAVRGKKVKDDSLTGADIDEATLGEVPNARRAVTASSAQNADQLDGLDSTEFQRVRERVFQVARPEVRDFAAGSTLAELTVPEGTYIALAKLSIIHPNAGNDATTTCDLSVPGPLGDSQRSRMGGGGTAADQLGFPLATTFTGAGQLRLSCSNSSGANDAFNIKLIAIRLD
jgi:hypothetical protein